MLEWDDKYSVGISLIDKEHKKLFGLINKTFYVEDHGGSKEALRVILEQMTDYALTHFKAEETYMKEFNYPEYQDHKKEHDDFFDHTLVYFDKVVKDNHHVSNELHEYLTQWLVNHIQGSDRQYIDCFKKNGLI